MSVIVVIPARYRSSRFPAKPLAGLKGAGGASKTLLSRCIDAARLVRGTDRLVVATDDPRIADEAQRAGVEAIMTSPERRNGTERVAETAAELGLDREDIIVNLQGDAPLTPPWFVEALIEAMAREPATAVATPVLRCDETSLRHFLDDRAAGRVGATTVAVSRAGNALYFSKEVIPFTGGRTSFAGPIPVFHHVGLYAYRPEALAAYAGWDPTPLEITEGLEQLRFLEMGWPIKAVEVDGRGRVFWEVNNPEDVARVEQQLLLLGMP